MSWSEIALIIVSIINALGVFLTPIITSLINSKNTIKIEKTKMFDVERIKSLNSFIVDSHNYFSLVGNGSHTSEETIFMHKKMINSLLNLQMYFSLPPDIRERMFKMERMGGYETDWNFRNDLIVSLSNQVNKYLK